MAGPPDSSVESPSGTPVDTRETIRERALEIGFDTVGFAPADVPGGFSDELNAYLSAGRHGDMSWLATHADRRATPRALWPDVKTVISLGLSYAPAGDPNENLHAALAARECGTVSAYARGRDYHDTVKKRLKKLARWIHENWPCEVKVFVDTAPVLEKPLAQSAGIGWQGKHTNLVSTEHGSWLFLGEIYTDIELAPDNHHRDLCGTCNRCQDICPTNAFPTPYTLDARRCISYLTIEHKGHIDRGLRPMMGNRIYGCDDCLAVCPWNKFAATTSEPDFLPRVELTAPRLTELAQLNDSGFRTLFSRSPIKRLGRDRFVRNVLIAIGNSQKPELACTALDLVEDPAPVVRVAAVWALARLLPKPEFDAIMQQYIDREADADVREEWHVAQPTT
jgi:epoxyqueuosine reductase